MPTYTRPLLAVLGPARSGLAGALGYAVAAPDGTPLVARTTAGVAEVGSTGTYTAAVAGWDTSWSGWIEWDAGAGVLAVEEFLAYAPQSGDSFSLLGSPSAGTIAADIAAVESGLAAVAADYQRRGDPVTLPDPAPAGYGGGEGGGGDATLANQATILAHLGDIMGAAFDPATDSLEALRDRGDAAWTTGSGTSGDGSVEVGWDHGGGDLRYLTAQGAGVDNGIVRAYLTADLAAGNRVVRGQAATDAEGKWRGLFLDPGAYTLSFSKQGEYLESTATLAVA